MVAPTKFSFNGGEMVGGCAIPVAPPGGGHIVGAAMATAMGETMSRLG